MRNTILCIVSIIIMAYMAVALMWSRMQASERMCTGVSIDINDTSESGFVTRQGIQKEIGHLTEKATQMRLRTIDTDSIERQLNLVDNIEGSVVTRLTDGSVRIYIDPMRPVARIFDSTGSYYINKDGKRITATARYHIDVPVISGNFNVDFRPQSLLPLVEYINSDSTLTNLVTHIKADGPSNIILVPIIRGHVINLGTAADLPDKFSRLMRAYREILPVRGWEYYDTLSVKWQGQIVATKRKKALHTPISAIDFEAEREAPDVGTMLVGDTTLIPDNKIIPADRPTQKKN